MNDATNEVAEAGLETEGPQTFNAAEEQDLARLLSAPLAQQRFEVPGSVEGFFIVAQMWTAEVAERFRSTGFQLRTPQNRKTGEGLGYSETRLQTEESYRLLTEACIVDFRLALNGRPVSFEAGRPDNNWRVYRNLPAPVGEWVRKTLSDFLGLGQEGNAFASASKPLLETGDGGS